MKVLITESQNKRLFEGRYINIPMDNDASVELWDSGERFDLESIVIPKQLRGQGYGTEIMNKIIKLADDESKPIYLTPDTSFGGSSFKRLVSFYKRFGFVKNDDKSVTKHFMVRYPQVKKNTKKQYIGQCDTLRRGNEQNEEYWQQMMSNKQKIDFNQFINGVDMDRLLDDGETTQEFIQDLINSDPSTSAYVSNWGNKETYFIQTAGFEFIFV
jgi:predicted GNAT family acetyltransferase